MYGEVQASVCMSVWVCVCVYMCVCICVCVHYSTRSAGKLGISSKRFQAWSAMKAQLRDESAAVAHR